ncbi:hypothetical protein [Kyrpidia tusciae]|uniref:Type I restriction enzyme R protein N-terminal domain-containing protein n=1 Tax=Kyrpidia tusciae (strain DSM 2912 / NBRC 15312 / T2) TaxID=562970 RepID=D5WUU0_KYRT2|nr:hypothetical protein [Kyrpidia tusciae]ADG07412.1 conserved hypothetical protein [Kyrpidia tusciae DSM 2912]
MKMFRPDFYVVRKRVEKSLNMLIRNDIYLFEIDVHERTIAHRLAVYLEKEFSSWNIDCEYNRNGYNPKLINLGSRGERRAYPDIIIHHRGTSSNLLAIEMKKLPTQVDPETDKDKLKQYIRHLDYKFGLFLLLSTSIPGCGISEIEWFDEHGRTLS